MMHTIHTEAFLALVKYNKEGLVTAIAQEDASSEVLMVAYMNEATLRQSLETGIMTYWSRSRQKVWIKGESSGNTQEIKEVRIDCDGDALLFKIVQIGRAACHTGKVSCFYRRLDKEGIVDDGEQVFDPKEIYGK